MLAIFNLPLTRTSESVHIIPAVLFDPENVGVACAISLPSCVQAELYADLFQVHNLIKSTSTHTSTHGRSTSTSTS